MLRWLAVAAAGPVAGYAVIVGLAWARYGIASPPERPEEDDLLLDRVMPAYEVVERHQQRVAAPAEVTLAAAGEFRLTSAPLVRSIIRAREICMGSRPDQRPAALGLLDEVKSLGWGVLAEQPGREIVMGAITKPWEADVVFRALPPQDFTAFHEPGFAKIVWTLRADPVDSTHSIFRTETRVMTTDAESRRLFRRYWAFVSPGIWLIRWVALDPVRKEAERRARLAAPR